MSHDARMSSRSGAALKRHSRPTRRPLMGSSAPTLPIHEAPLLDIHAVAPAAVVGTFRQPGAAAGMDAYHEVSDPAGPGIEFGDGVVDVLDGRMGSVDNVVIMQECAGRHGSRLTQSFTKAGTELPNIS